VEISFFNVVKKRPSSITQPIIFSLNASLVYNEMVNKGDVSFPRLRLV